MIRRLMSTLYETIPQIHKNDINNLTNQSTNKNLSNFGWLTNVAPCFPINSKNLEILNEPQEFYDVIKQFCSNAKHRITLASLYIGTNKLEKQLIDCLNNNPQYINGQLELNVLLDYTRGSRGGENSRTILMPLLEKNDRKCNITFYHTPVLRGLLKTIVPQRFNEIFGLQHMKLYIFDNTLIISGANLSSDYFINRQDRYMIIYDENLTNFFDGLIKIVQKFSLKIDKKNQIKLDDNWQLSPYNDNQQLFIDKASKLIKNYINLHKNNHLNHTECDTFIFPLIQMAQLNVIHEAPITERLLAESQANTNLYIATGYFNLTTNYMKTLIGRTTANCHILMAHPLANGFYGAKGVAGGIPDAYSLIATRFWRDTKSANQQHRIRLYEYLKNGWTYHAKGLWYYAPNSQTPCLTLIGSPNFGERSTKRDLECQLAIFTQSEDLSKRLDDECKNIFKSAKPAIIGRTIPLWVYPFVYFCRTYF